MARTVKEIHNELKGNFVKHVDLQNAYKIPGSEINNDHPYVAFEAHFSKMSIENLFLYIVALSIFILEQLFSTHQKEVKKALLELKPHSQRWYVEKAKKFQFSSGLMENSDDYETTDESLQIVTHAAVDEKESQLYMKVAKKGENGLTLLTDEEKYLFVEYMERVKDAGVKIYYATMQGDVLKLEMDIYYDPLVIDKNGKLINDTNTEPARETIKYFIENLSFNGEFVLADLVAALQDTPGIDIPIVRSAESRQGSKPFVPINVKIKPEAGYLVIAENDNEDFLTLNYKANVQGQLDKTNT